VRQPLAGPGRTKKRPNTAGRFYPNAVGYRKPHGYAPVFSQSFGKYRKDERCRTCGHAKGLQVQENKGQEIDDFCGAANMWKLEKKPGVTNGLGGSGAKKDLQVIENTRRGEVIGGAGCGASETICRCHSGC